MLQYFKMAFLLSKWSCLLNFLTLGSIVHTGMQNELGGYENDCSVARLAENHFMLMSPSIQQMRSYSWMKHRLPADGSVYLQVSFNMHTYILFNDYTLSVLGYTF